MEPERGAAATTGTPGGRARRAGPGSPSRPEGVGARSDAARRVALVALLASLVPIAVATGRAVAEGWLPVGDNAFFAIRAHDTFNRHIPLLGTWTSASLSVGEPVNNPGPLLFWALAVPVRVLGWSTGTAVGIGLLNAASLAGAVAVAWRRAGPVGAALAAAAGTGLAWSMGSELLFEPWQPHSLLLPAYATLVAAWAVASGDAPLLPLLVFAASFLTQTHLTYVYLVATAGTLAVVGLGRAARRDGVPVRRPALLAAGVALGCWAAPLWEQVRVGRDGNLGRLLGAVGSQEGAAAGWENALRLWASVGGRWPLWLRDSFRDALGWDPLAGRGAAGVGGAVTGLPSLGHALVALALTVTALGLLGWWALRRRDRVAVAGVLLAAVSIGATLLTIASIPEGVLGIAPHQLRYLWPVTAYSAFAATLAVARLVPRADARRVLGVAGTATAVTVALAAANLGRYEVRSGPSLDAWAIPIVADLNRQLARMPRPDGPLLFDTQTLRFAEPYSTPIMAELQRRGIEFRVAEEGWVRQLGRDRRYLPGGAVARIGYRTGPGAGLPPPGGRIVAYHAALGPGDQRERTRLARAVAAYLEAGRLRLSARGRHLVRRGQLRTLAPLRDGPVSLRAAKPFASGELLRAVPAGALELPPSWDRRFRRWAVLERDAAFRTVGVYLAPIE